MAAKLITDWPVSLVIDTFRQSNVPWGLCIASDSPLTKADIGKRCTEVGVEEWSHLQLQDHLHNFSVLVGVPVEFLEQAMIGGASA